MEDENMVSTGESVLFPEDDAGSELSNESETEVSGEDVGADEEAAAENTVTDEGAVPGDDAVSGDEVVSGDGEAALGEPVVVSDDTETNALLTSLLEQSTELTEAVQLVYEEAHIPLNEVTVASLGFRDFVLLGIFLVLLAEFILKHLGGIFRCTK